MTELFQSGGVVCEATVLFGHDRVVYKVRLESRIAVRCLSRSRLARVRDDGVVCEVTELFGRDRVVWS
ncbi:hypothetical protein [Pseudoalteromonas rubra]|uniref:hypothetical protein n=1 Tax=Pseudoalteromonas rubra TaxID=43658 RepID=UPI001109AE22|nr:hypothetical protein [Pseudoalteromonas rubra]